jgi:hypothetical protein
MKDTPTLYKVVDNDTRKNVADKFTTQENAEQFVNYHKFKQTECENSSTDGKPRSWNYMTEKCVSRPPTDPNGSTTKDGVKVPVKIKGEWKYDFDKDPKDGGARYNGPAAGTSVVMVGYFTMNGGSDDVSAKLLGGRHTDDNPPGNIAGTCYDLGIETDTGRPRLRIECPHADMSDDLQGSVDEQGVDFMGKWVGMIAIAQQEPDGVRIQYWQDQGDNESSPANQWKKLYEYFDTGQSKPGDADDSKFPLKDLSLAKNTEQNTWRIDHSPGLDAKWLAVAEIDVG